MNLLLVSFIQPQIIPSILEGNSSSIDDLPGVYIQAVAGDRGRIGILYHPPDNQPDENSFRVYSASMQVETTIAVPTDRIPLYVSNQGMLFITQSTVARTYNETGEVFTTNIYLVKDNVSTTLKLSLPRDTALSGSVYKLDVQDVLVDGNTVSVLYTINYTEGKTNYLNHGVVSFDISHMTLIRELSYLQHLQLTGDVSAIRSQMNLAFTSSSSIHGTESLTYSFSNGSYSSVVNLQRYRIDHQNLTLLVQDTYVYDASAKAYMYLGDHILQIISYKGEYSLQIQSMDTQINFQTNDNFGDPFKITPVKISDTMIAIPLIYNVGTSLQTTDIGFTSSVRADSFYYIFNTRQPDRLTKVKANPNNYNYYRYRFQELINGYVAIIQNVSPSSNRVSYPGFTIISYLNGGQILNNLVSSHQVIQLLLPNGLFFAIVIIVLLYNRRNKHTSSDLYPDANT